MQIPVTPVMVITALGIGTLSAFLAYKRGRSPFIWFFAGFLFGIFGIFAIFFAPNKKVYTLPEIKREPIVKIQGPTDKFWYYLDPSNQQQGPMSHDALTLAWKQGKIDPSTFIWHEDLAEWKPLKETLKAES